MSDIRLSAEHRASFGKGAARRIRRDSKIPAVLYGHGTDPVHIILPGHDTMLALKNANALLTIQLDGRSELALAKDVQRHPLKPVIEHVDLLLVRRGEKVTVDVPVHLEGEAGADSITRLESQTLQLLVEATQIPEALSVSVEALPAGSQVHAADVSLPAGAELVSDPQTLVVNVTAMISQEDLDAELGEPEAAEEESAAPDDIGDDSTE